MPKKKNTTLRLLVPIVGFLVIVGVGIAMSINSSAQQKQTREAEQAGRNVASTNLDETPGQTSSTAPAQTPGQAAAQDEGDPASSDPASGDPVAGDPVAVPPASLADVTNADLTGLIARADPSAPHEFTSLGSLDDESDYEFAVSFTPYGAGLYSLQLTHEYETVMRAEHHELQAAMRGNATVSVSPAHLDAALEKVTALGGSFADDIERAAALGEAASALSEAGLEGYAPELFNVITPATADVLVGRVRAWVGQLIVPFALVAVEIDGQRVDLANLGGEGGMPRGVWSQESPGVFVATIENESGEAVATVRRVFEIKPESYEFTLSQSLVNLTSTPMSVRWVQTGPIDPPKSRSTYGGDKRRFRFGYLLDPKAQSGDPTVLADNELEHHHEFLGKKIDANGNGVKTYPIRDQLWPTTKAEKNSWRMVWAGFTDRYFAVAVYPMVPTGAPLPPDAKVFGDITQIDRLVLNPAASNVQNTTAVLDLRGPARSVAPGSTLTSAMGIFAGPMEKPLMAGEPRLKLLGLDRVIVYNFGSCTAACTFGWLTHLLLEVLRFNHKITFDWAIAIILLVVMVRTVLHPITRWSQIKMQRFGAQMQAVGPKQVKLKEKFKEDPRKLQQETAKLWKEEGISPAGFLGCLPMFLQSPVWIALYATLFFASELRHEPAFYGVFQTISSGSWGFLADLSAPDAALPLGPLAFRPPIIGNFTGVIDTVNILPILMGFVFYAHQKYLTPPTTATLTPEQQSQQKMIKMMSVLMFPLIMYPAPSGLAIYFVTNSTIAIFENRHIRSHMNKHGLLDPDKIKAAKANKKPGFIARLQKMAEAQAQAKADAKSQGKGYGTGKNRGYKASGPSKKTINRQYKKK
ncbi:MAG: YidC/Oxa1 family membrane protein insertase [Phycisphaerales bacterium]|jgi:YidC/Oxa1 family membrane protein insertase